MKIYPTSLIKGGNCHDTHLQLVSDILVQSTSNNNKKKVACCHKLAIMTSDRKKIALCLIKTFQFQVSARMLTATEHVPLGDLPPGIVTDLLPVLASASFCCGTEDQPPYHLIAGSPFGIQHQKFNTYFFKTLTRDIENKQFIEHGIGGALLHMSLLFGDSLFGMVQVDFDVGICKKYTAGIITSELKS